MIKRTTTLSKIIRASLKVMLLAAFVTVSMSGFSHDAYASNAPEWIQRLEGANKDETKDENNQNDELAKWQKERDTKKVPILLYHHITDEKFSNEQAISFITPEDFRLHMTAIKVNYNPISLRQYYEYVNCTDGSVNIPDNPIIITFDDGYLSNYEIAYPILKELEIPATIFVVTDTVGATADGGAVNYPHFTWQQAKEMEDSGLIEIQSHTAGHVKMTEKSQGEQIRQLRKSKYEIEKNLGRTCDMIAYPYGEYTPEIKEMAKASGYKVQCLVDDKNTMEDYMVNLPKEGVENLTRMTIAGTMGNVNVIEIIRNTVNKK